MSDQEKIELVTNLCNICEQNTIAVNCGGRRKENPEKELRAVRYLLEALLNRKPTDEEIDKARGV